MNGLFEAPLAHHKHAFETTGDTTAGIDRFSSGAFFDGWLALPSRSRPAHRSPKHGDPVVKPTCWLLTKTLQSWSLAITR